MSSLDMHDSSYQKFFNALNVKGNGVMGVRLDSGRYIVTVLPSVKDTLFLPSEYDGIQVVCEAYKSAFDLDEEA